MLNLHGSGHGRHYIPPPDWLKTPFTARKRELFIYLMQELGVRSLTNGGQNSEDLQQNASIMHRPILVAIPIGDVLLLRYLFFLAARLQLAFQKPMPTLHVVFNDKKLHRQTRTPVKKGLMLHLLRPGMLHTRMGKNP